MADDKSFKLWDVKPIWSIRTSKYTPTIENLNIEIYGMDRTTHNNAKAMTRTSSMEKYNQGYVEEVEDLRVSIFVKEGGGAFEVLRRLSVSKVFFKVDCSILTDSSGGELAHVAPWMKGFEEWEGCMIVNDVTNYAVAEYPVREFEVMALEHTVKKPDEDQIVLADGTILPVTEDITEGDGTFKRSL